jgi:hypothetical protein
LARFEAIQADEQAWRLENRPFPHPVGPPLGVIGGADYFGLRHNLSFHPCRVDTLCVRRLRLSRSSRQRVELGTSFEALE